MLALGAIVALGGCTKPNPDGRENVSGVIKLNGTPLEKSAAIRFAPVSGSSKDGGGGPIYDGKYLLTGNNGVKPGKYIVRITATTMFDTKTSAPATSSTGDFDMVSVPLIPPEFNDESKLEFEVVAGKRNVFNYDVVTDYVPSADNMPQPKRGQYKATVQ